MSRKPTYNFGFLVGEGGVEEDLLNSQRVARRHDDPRRRHWGLPVFLLQAVSNHQKGSQTNIHSLEGPNDNEKFDTTEADRQQNPNVVLTLPRD